jgi:hypothetical protein
MTFNQWWGSHEWSFILQKLVEPLAKVFAEMAWNAAVQAEREECARVADKWAEGPERNYSKLIADEIRSRGQA